MTSQGDSTTPEDGAAGNGTRPNSIQPRRHAGHAMRAERRGEVRLPAVIAVLIAITLYAALPSSLLIGPRYVVPILEGALLISLLLINPWRMTKQTRYSRIAALALSVLIIASNLVALGYLVNGLVDGQSGDGKSLLVAGLQVWATNVISFALIFWELDRGGAVARTQAPRSALQLADFRFTHDEDDDTVQEVAGGSSKVADWVPTFVDYLYLSTTNSSAFSPTDTMPLTSRAKILMGIEATAALLTSLLVIARAVGGLGG